MKVGLLAVKLCLFSFLRFQEHVEYVYRFSTSFHVQKTYFPHVCGDLVLGNDVKYKTYKWKAVIIFCSTIFVIVKFADEMVVNFHNLERSTWATIQHLDKWLEEFTHRACYSRQSSLFIHNKAMIRLYDTIHKLLNSWIHHPGSCASQPIKRCEQPVGSHTN